MIAPQWLQVFISDNVCIGAAALVRENDNKTNNKKK